MTVSTETRLESLEREVSRLRDRLAALEGQPASVVRARRPAPPRPAPVAPVAPARPRHPRPAWPSLEEFLGGRLLAFVGGAALLLGVAFFVALAVDRGWVGETARVLLAFVGSALLLGLGVWLHERRGRTQASLAIVGTAIAALYLSLAAATALYELVPAAAGLAGAFAIGALATALAVRWNARPVAGLGILGALAAPLLAQAGGTEAVAFLLVALAAAAAVLVWRRWDWLAVGAFLVSTLQLALWALDEPRPAVLVAVLAAAVALNLGSALGGELRSRRAASPAAVLLVSASALVLGALGVVGLPHGDGELSGGLWLAGLAVAHGALAVAVLRSDRLSDATGLALAGVAGVVANTSFALLVDGWLVAAGFAASAVVVAAAGRRARDPRAVDAALGGQLTLAIVHALLFDASPDALSGGFPTDAVSALAAIAVAAFGAARLSSGRPAELRHALDALSLATLAAVTALALDGQALVFAWAGQAVVVAGVGRRTGDLAARFGAIVFVGLAAAHALTLDAEPRLLAEAGPALGAAAALAAVAGAAFAVARLCGRETAEPLDVAALAALAYAGAFALDGTALVLAWCAAAAVLVVVARNTGSVVARFGALALAGLGAGHALALEAPPTALADGVDHLLPVAAAVAAAAAALHAAARVAPGRAAVAFEALAAGALVQLGSVAIVSAFAPAPEQRAQVAVSAFWAACGLAALLVGLRRDGLRWRVAGFGLLGLAAGKVFLYDLANLDSLARAGSFVALGLLLLASAYAYQRLRAPALEGHGLEAETARGGASGEELRHLRHHPVPAAADELHRGAHAESSR